MAGEKIRKGLLEQGEVLSPKVSCMKGEFCRTSFKEIYTNSCLQNFLYFDLSRFDNDWLLWLKSALLCVSLIPSRDPSQYSYDPFYNLSLFLPLDACPPVKSLLGSLDSSRRLEKAMKSAADEAAKKVLDMTSAAERRERYWTERIFDLEER